MQAVAEQVFPGALTQDQARDQAQSLANQVEQAFVNQQPLVICGGGSKRFYGRPLEGETLSLSDYQGIVSYEPSELVITARAGTPLQVIETVLAEQGQMLGFEPPHYADNATLGGTIACGLSGPRRPYSGAARDFVLGVTMINGKGEILRFGGQVMKNVAGYDVSRLMSGAQGTLGVLLEISLKVIPMPAHEETRVLSCSQQQMQTLLCDLGRQPLPISATLFHNDQLYIRLSGATAGVHSAAQIIGGERLSTDQFWLQAKEQQHPFFHPAQPCWRLSLPPAAAAVPDALARHQLIEWGGAQRWLYSEADPCQIIQWAEANGGHATAVDRSEPGHTLFHPLSNALLPLTQRIKQSFDPAGILNPGRLYTEL
ncbi:glycolate oxidase subunit GlcE [Amphritea japonica]|uniref:Glycolate oxidase FAD binding subunit n=1 Tax=Amphritea japonica ATCC BAA-1530 TaxID=1278309 RepID=A0A7R6SR02_9GAMM|nr:glycolate oxidase subunit GlcE [Amphritea japonica]BBB24704.1 glycolate oxidase FAD binding subunit [Amphritea japonica ATCC BAA-1530]